MARRGMQAGKAIYNDDYPERRSSRAEASARSDAMTYYGGLFSEHRAGSSVYGVPVPDGRGDSSVRGGAARRRRSRPGSGSPGRGRPVSGRRVAPPDRGRPVSGSRAASSVSGEPDSGRKTASSAYGEPSFGDRTASSIYGDQASGHRAGRSVFGGLLDDAPPPPSERRHERRRKQAAGQGVRISRYSRPALPHISAAEKGILIFVAAFVAAALVGVIALEAYSVSIQHGINKKNTERAAIQKDIDELYVAIEQGSNISVIEKRAEKDLKMRYPAQDQLKYGKDIAAEVADAGASEGAKS